MTSAPSSPGHPAHPSLVILLQHARGGDEAARQALFRRLRIEMRTRALRKLGERQPLGVGASDIANDAAIKLLRRLSALHATTDAEVRDYAYTIVERCVIDLQRRAERQMRDAVTTVPLSDHQGELAVAQPGPSEAARESEQMQGLWLVLSRLDPVQAHALLLKYEGRTLQEIGAALGRSPEAAANVLCRAVKRARAELGRSVGGEEDSRVLLAFKQYLFEVEAGRGPAQQEFLAAHPEIAGPLREVLGGLDEVLRLMRRAEEEED